MKTVSVVLVALFSTVGCSDESPDLEVFSAEATLDELGTLEIACPIGVVCDETFDYRAYRYESDDIYLYLSFDPSVVGNFDLDSLQTAFNYANIELRFPDRSDDENVRYYVQTEPLRELTFDAFEGSRLKFSISGEADRITEQTSDSSDPDCSSGDILGVCYRSIDADVVYDIEFDLEVPAS